MTRDLTVDTAVLCGACQGEGTAPGTHPIPCETCHGAGEVAHVQRSFLGEIRTLRPCAACRGFGSIIPEPCRECSGDGRVRSRRTITVKIPAGVDNGTRVQLTEQGEVGPGGGPPGDLYVEIQIARHDTFTRHGNDLHCTVTLPMTAAALGTTLTLPTLEADVEQGADSGVETTFELDIRPGTQSGTEQVLRGRGVPGLRGGRGDLVVTVVVETPTRLDARQEELLRELAAIRGEEQPDRPRPPGLEVGVRPAARRVQPALMSLPVHVVPSLDGVAAGSAVEVDRRRGAPCRRRTPAAGGRAGRAHRRLRSLGDRRRGEHRQAGLLRHRRPGRAGTVAGARAGGRAGAAEG